MSVTATKTRFKTGEESPHHSIYRFDGYVDGTSSPPPMAEERDIEITRGENFPSKRSAGKSCWWLLQRKLS